VNDTYLSLKPHGHTKGDSSQAQTLLGYYYTSILTKFSPTIMSLSTFMILPLRGIMG